MSEFALRMEHVFKKFSRGERHDSLRDLIPALARRAVRRVVNPLDLKRQEFWALRDVTFDIKKGESVAIVGHNGAGKSTMLKHFSGLMKPTSGRIEVNGRLSALIEVGAGFHQDLTGRENVFLNGVILGMTRAEVRRKFDEIVEFSGLKDFIDTPVKRYSSGMYARLGFSVAVHMEPDILIIDEVLSVGDYVFQQKGVDKMRSILRSGATVIFVSHNLRAVADLCERSLLMSKGQLIQDGPTSEVIQAYLDQVKRARYDESKDVFVEQVIVRGPNGPRADFSAGDRAWIDVTLRAVKPVKNMACFIVLRDDKHQEIFNTSSERLGQAPFTLEAGETRTCTFEVTLHLAAGTFHVSAGLFRYDIDKLFDLVEGVTSIFIKSPVDVRGAANLYPRVLVQA